MSSCVKPLVQNKEPPIVLLHGFDRCSKFARDKISFYILCSSWSWIFYCLITQFMFRMEIWISIAWRIWFRDLGYRHSWLGFLWFRFVLLLCLMQLVPLPPFFVRLFLAFNSKFSFIHQKIFLLVTWYQNAITSIRFLCTLFKCISCIPEC